MAKREEVKRTGIYVLFGPDPEVAMRDAIYFGEGDNVLTRLTAHDKDESKDFWTRCAVVISKDQNIAKSHGRYLESRLITLAHQADRAKILNGTAPPLPPLPEPDIADMEYFLSQLTMVFPILGFQFLQTKPVIDGNGTGPSIAARASALSGKEKTRGRVTPESPDPSSPLSKQGRQAVNDGRRKN